jgi:hypothetical protein
LAGDGVDEAVTQEETMCDYRYGIEGKIKELQGNYDIESLKWKHQSTLDDLDRITRGITQYLAAIDEQMKVFQATTFKTYVFLERKDYGHVEYLVDVRQVPQVPQILNLTSHPERGHLFLLSFLRGQSVGIDKISLPRFEDEKKFGGREGRAAIAYADELAKKHNAEIIKAGSWKKKAA